MTKYNRNFCKPDESMKPLYGPMPLAVVIHHHDEWDEPVLDPETGEPTGETEHKTADWDERRTVIHPTAEDFALMGYLPLSPDYPVDPPEGRHYERTDKIEPNGEYGYRWVYALVDNPLPTVADFDFAMEEHLRTEREARGYTTREPDAYLESSNPRWRQDAHDWVAHRDAVMFYALSIINAVESGEREPPTMEEFVEGLPNIV